MSGPGQSDDGHPSLRALGETLRSAREQRGLSIGELADLLHLGEEQVRALEEADTTDWPEPVYIRARIRAVARAVGLDGDTLLDSLPPALKRQGPGAVKPPAAPVSAPAPAAPPRPTGRRAAADSPPGPKPSPGSGDRPSGRTTALAWLVLVLAVLAGGAWLWNSRSELFPAGGPAAGTPAAPESPDAPEIEEVAPEAAPSPAAPPEAEPTAATIRIQPIDGQPSWLAIRSGDGTLLFEGTFSEERELPADAGVEVYAGRPDLVAVGRGSGPMQPLGSIESVRWLSLDELISRPAP
ncbi:helix-turn-helix domain-containing protein [Synechococcus sp. RSCCF101]|uniref:helix-turn-helix domain-containing protein n=1 Tax=Synechococcus sp. RSCCF101 TaxID=2511069 RepID=UPI001245B462|nr:helix-turn-helix domain-containing protein [Synechococcus sp. RSCCF101]QEY30958.1 helix-turn-helix domain-containing protein [Synechococcus sp. RSCCF101]